VRPAWSVILFTTLAGAGQGLFLAVFAAEVLSRGPVLFPSAIFSVLLLTGAGLIASFFHLGHPERAWRSAAMWRTSWLSREVIVLPLFMASVALWGFGHWTDAPRPAVAAVAALLALVLYLCTGMIYGAVRAIREWAHPITPTNYLILGLASGLLLAAAMAAALAPPLAGPLAQLALAATLIGAATRGWALWRNLNLAPKTTLQSAIGVRHPRIEQKAQGAMGGSFNTREFFHQRTPEFVARMRWGAAVLAFVVPVVALAAGAQSLPALAALFTLQYLGLLAERWSFFAEGQHPQNLYYRTMS